MKEKTKSPIKRYSEEMLFEVYELAVNGLTKEQIAHSLSIPFRRLKRWQLRYPVIRIAYSKGKEMRKGRMQGNKPTETIEQYVHKRLNPALKPLWKKLKEFDNEPNAAKRVEALLQDKGKLVKQQLFLHALVSSSFKASDSMRKCNVSYSELKNWKLDPQFGDLLDEITHYKRAFIEDKVMEAVQRNEPWAIQMAAKGVLKDTYGDHSVVKHEGQITHSHQHEFVPVEKLSLPTRKLIMQELEAAEKDRIEDAEILKTKMREES